MRKKRATKKIEIWAKLTQSGIQIPSPVNRNRIALAAQNMPPNGENVKLTIEFARKSKSGEMMGLYWGAVLPLWIAHKKDLIDQNSLEKDPMILSRLVKQRKISAKEIQDLHEDMMLEFRPVKGKNWLTGKTETKRDRLSEMDSYNAQMYVAEVYQYVVENSGIELKTEEYKNARDNVEMLINKQYENKN